MPRSASWRWRMIFWPARSVASAMRAQNDDRSDARFAARAPDATARPVPVIDLLPAAAATDARARSAADAVDRRAASRAPVRRQSDAARPAQSRRIRGWTQTRGDVDATKGYRSPVSEAAHQRSQSRAPGVS